MVYFTPSSASVHAMASFLPYVMQSTNIISMRWISPTYVPPLYLCQLRLVVL